MERNALTRLKRLAGKQTTTLTHYGRKTGKPHEVTIWFVLDGDKLYIGTANVNRQWVRNVQKTPKIRLSMGGEAFDGNARFLTDRAEHERAMAAIRHKYCVRQFAALKKHRREQIYDLGGNHDRSGLNESQEWWWRKWVDPTGEYTQLSHVDASKRPVPINGTWERYSFRAGNLLFLMMSDINEPSQKLGRGTLGGNPAGVVSGDTFRWWKRMVEQNPSSIIISAHHYVLNRRQGDEAGAQNTTVASGDWEGFHRDEKGQWKDWYHGYYEGKGSPRGASYLYWVDSKQDSGAFEDGLNASPGRVDLWLGAHTHTAPNDTYGGKSHIEQRWGTTFINVAGLTKYMGSPQNCIPRSWLLTFTEASDEVAAQCYLHTSDCAPQGWFPKFDRVIKITKPFRMPARSAV